MPLVGVGFAEELKEVVVMGLKPGTPVQIYVKVSPGTDLG